MNIFKHKNGGKMTAEWEGRMNQKIGRLFRGKEQIGRLVIEGPNVESVYLNRGEKVGNGENLTLIVDARVETISGITINNFFTLKEAFNR